MYTSSAVENQPTHTTPRYWGLSPVFIGTILFLTPIILSIVFFPQASQARLSQLHLFIVTELGWVYSLIVGAILCSIIGLAISPYGHIKLGPDHSTPSFSYHSWIAMLFSAGMGIGILFFGVYEPLTHFVHAPKVEAGSLAAARESMRLTFFHWGLHAWGIYAIVGLLLAFFSFRHKLPLSLRSALYPLIGDKIYGPIGHMVDIFAILGTIFGLATSLGLGGGQIGSGLQVVFAVPNTMTTQMVLIVLLMFFAGMSAVSGLNKGLKFLSELNLYLALLLLLCVTLVGPTSLILQAFLQNTGEYMSSIVRTTFNLYAYEPQSKSQTWLSNWTILYWGWWLSWSPFVGIFIARISRGRTIREFVIGVLLIPSALTFFWMTAFGNTAIEWVLHGGRQELVEVAAQDSTLALFEFFRYFPWSTVFNGFAIVVIMVFFVTSADSGALVVDMLGAQRPVGAPPILWQRVFWVAVITLVSMVLMAFDGIAALQKITLISSLPYAVVLFFAIFGLFRALKRDFYKQQTRKFANVAPIQASTSWKTRVRNIVHFPNKQRVFTFLESTVQQAMQELVTEFEKRGVILHLEMSERSIRVVVPLAQSDDFIYNVRMVGYTMPSFMLSGITEEANEDAPEVYFRAEVHLTEGGQDYDIYGYTKEQVIADVLDQYEKHLHFLHMVENRAW